MWRTWWLQNDMNGIFDEKVAKNQNRRTSIDASHFCTNKDDLMLWVDEGIRIWNGTLRLDATNTNEDHAYKIRCSCHKEHLEHFRCTHGKGRVRKGEFKHLSIKVPEPAINTAILTVWIDDMDAALNLYMLEGAKELYFGPDDSESLTESVTEKNPASMKPKWTTRSGEEGAFEGVSDLIKPAFKNIPKGLSNYLTGPSSKGSTWQRLNELVYPVVLELLQDLGDFAKKEVEKKEGTLRSELYKSNLLTGSKNTDVGKDLAEVVLIRLSEKLRSEYGRSNTKF
ncbi:hypothetical protein RB195_020754 [Necator americanus]|uniref:Uncharacterized protein n=1 Tax=Necator americanus TaxID=51031 RepID=A0ABR1CKC1_NECAM